MAAFGSPFPLIAAYQRKWPFGKTMCIIYGFVMAFGGIGSITTLMVLAFERYLMISKPFRVKRIEVDHVMGILVAIWIYTAILTLPPLFGWASYDFEGPRISCSIGWEAGDRLTNVYIVFLFVLGLVLPVIVILVSSCEVIRTLRMASGAQSRVANRAEVHVVVMISVMITCFIVAWMPYALVSILATLGISVSPQIAIVPALIAKTSTCYNPVIYVGLNTQFREAWKKLFGLRVTENREAVMETSYTTAAAAPTPNNATFEMNLLLTPANNF